MKIRSVALALLVLSGCAVATRPGPAAPAPSLVVVLVVDQMRTDYLERAAPHMRDGLRRLTTEGAWWKDGAYPYLNTVTCAGHATIGTGALPFQHGMVLNAWFDRGIGRERPCTFDETVANIGHSDTAAGGDSARWLLVPTLSQRLREQTGGRSVALSLKQRSAITLAGPGPSAVVWFNERAGWTTSTAFTAQKIDWIEEFVKANPVAADAGKVWDRLLPASAYAGSDEAAGERPPRGWTQSFPHALPQAEEPGFLSQWQRTPFADEYLARMAAAAVDSLGLGRGAGIDFLGVSFSTLDLTGHQFGPVSHEVQDLVLRLDRTIGTLMDHLDASVGRGRYVVALSSDHGVAPVPDQTEGSGRQTGAQALAAIDRALVPFFGEGKYAAHAVYTDLYLAPGVLDRLESNAKAMAAVLDALRALPGVAQAFRGGALVAEEARNSEDPALRAAAISHYPPRSGDLIIVPRRHWLLSTSSATTHGTLYPYDQRVPVVFYGPGVGGGIRRGPATPADIAPTLAALARFPFSAPGGTALNVR